MAPKKHLKASLIPGLPVNADCLQARPKALVVKLKVMQVRKQGMISRQVSKCLLPS